MSIWEYIIKEGFVPSIAFVIGALSRTIVDNMCNEINNFCITIRVKREAKIKEKAIIGEFLDSINRYESSVTTLIFEDQNVKMYNTADTIASFENSKQAYVTAKQEYESYKYNKIRRLIT